VTLVGEACASCDFRQAGSPFGVQRRLAVVEMPLRQDPDHVVKVEVSRVFASRNTLLAGTLAIVAAHHAQARPLNSFVGSQNLGAGATVSVGNGAYSVDVQGVINITTGDFPLSGEPLSPSGFAYGVIEIIQQYFYASATVPLSVCFARVVNLGSGPFSTTHPNVENIAFVAGDGNRHVQFYLRPLATQTSYTLNFMCPPKD